MDEQEKLVDEELEKLIVDSMKILPLTDAIKPAKVKVPQSYIFHSISVGTLSYMICKAISKKDSKGISILENTYGCKFTDLCYYGGFFHDWMKLFSTRENNEFKILEEAKNRAKELAKKTNLPCADKLIDHIYTFAEGPLSNNTDLPLWVSVKLADMLMISEIMSASDVLKFAESKNYIDAIKALRSYGLALHYITASPRLFTILASEKIVEKVEELGGVPLITYKDGFVYLSDADSKPINLSEISKILESKFSSVDVEALRNQVEKCIRNKEEEWRGLNSGNSEVLYDEESGKPKQVNALLPTKVCTPFEDVVGNLSSADKVRVAEEVINSLKDVIPYGVLAYFVEKFSRYDKDYIRKKLNIKDKFPKYLETIKPEEISEKINKILEAIREKYSAEKGSLTLQSFVKRSFNGYVIDDIQIGKNIQPKNYCVVCGTPIYDNVVNFKQFSSLLRGKTEIWIPRESALEDIDSVRDSWTICPICNYEAMVLSNEFAPPFILVSFYPGVPIPLLEALNSLEIDENRKESIYSLVMSDKFTYYDLFVKSTELLQGEKIRKNIKADYLGGKVIIASTDIMEKRITRLDKESLNDLLYYVPFITIQYLFSPIFITGNIYDFPLTGRNVEITSEFNYLWTKAEGDDSNFATLLLLLAYAAKYEGLKKIFKKEDFINNLNSMINEMDLFASVSRSLSVITFGMAVNEDREKASSLFNSIKFFIPYLDFAFSRVDKMGESFSKALNSIAGVLAEIIKDKNVSKHQIVGFLRDGIDMFFKSNILSKEDRIEIAASAALNTLSNNYGVSDEQNRILFSKLKDIFSNLYDIEVSSDRSLAISISTALTNWLYLLFLYKKSKEGEKSE